MESNEVIPDAATSSGGEPKSVGVHGASSTAAAPLKTPRTNSSAGGRRVGFRLRGFLGTILWLPFLVVALLSPPLKMPVWLSFIVSVLAWITFVSGVAFRIWATLYVGGRKARTVVSEGPYSIVRHPLYLGTLLVSVAAPLFLRSPMLLFGIFLGAISYLLVTMPAEEQDLRDHFDDYDEFARRTPRLFPRFSQYHSPPMISVKVQSLYLEVKRMSRWIWIPLAAELVNHLRVTAWWQQHLYFFNLP
jgi:protein-S-isoprenylcysteine O-methyltransferase Ste14